MPNYSFSRSGRLYMAMQTVYGTAVTLSGSNACRHTKCIIKPANPRSPRNDKTGTLSRTPGIGGLRKATVSITMDQAAHGTPGVLPDCDPILQSLFGGPATVNAGVSVIYAPTPTTDANAVPAVTVGYYRLPSTVKQQIAWGTNFSSAKFGLNDGVIAKWSAEGEAGNAVDSLSFSALDTNGKGGISSFPAEPSSPVTSGAPVAAFQGSITIGGTSVPTLTVGALAFGRPVEQEYSYGNQYPTSVSPDMRSVGFGFTLKDDDSALMTALLADGISDGVVAASLVQGNVAGNIWTWALGGLQLTPPSPDDSSKKLWLAVFEESMASASAIAVTDEISLTIT
jgi:Phage tail tube protein